MAKKNVTLLSDFWWKMKTKKKYLFQNMKKITVRNCPTDWRPMAEIVFAKVKGVQKETITVDLEQFISVKGIKALGNQLTTDKLKQVNLLEPLPFEEPEEEQPEQIEVTDENNVSENIQTETDDDGQITLSLE